jgi:hypothetical protein
MPSLILIKAPGGSSAGQSYLLTADAIVLGREDTCDIVIPNHAVSRRHAQVIRSNGPYFIDDLKSRNHTFVNNRESFITTNRKAIATRYSFDDPTANNSDYLEEVPYFFLGWVAKQASEHSYSFEVLRAVRYANNCRFWLRTRLDSSAENWKRKHVVADRGGFKFQGFRLPRFAEVRKNLYSESQKSLFE